MKNQMQWAGTYLLRPQIAALKNAPDGGLYKGERCRLPIRGQYGCFRVCRRGFVHSLDLFLGVILGWIMHIMSKKRKRGKVKITSDVV